MPREDYDAFPKTDANYVPLSPLSFIRRAGEVHGDHTAVIHGTLRRTWCEAYDRCVRLGHALSLRGIGRNDTVSFLCPNTPEMIEAHFGVNMCGAVLNSINTRLDADTIAYILEHSESSIVFADTQYSPVMTEALAILGDKAPEVIDIADPQADLKAGEGERLGKQTYEEFIAARI